MIALLVALAFAFQSPPEGFKSFESRARGLALFIPADFEELPVQPGEEYIQLKFTQKESLRSEKGFRPEIWVVAIEKAALVSGGPEGTQQDPAEGRGGSGPAVRSFEQYLKEEMKAWDSKLEASGDRAKEKRPLDRYRLGRRDGSRAALAFTMDQGERIFCVFGIAEHKTLPDYRKDFERCARSLRTTEARQKLSPEVEAFYRMNPFRNLEPRLEVRRHLSKGWKAVDTENYILIYDTKDENLVAKIKNDLEAVRKKFVELFPPAKPIEAVSTVRVCKDREEFQKFSGMPPQVAGYWNSATEELVFFDFDSDPRSRQGGAAANRNSYIVLYHEAFHQYIYYSCGEIAPHSWFNEGYGDYFSGSVIGRGGRKVDRIEMNPWRVGVVKKIVEQGEHAPLKDLVRFEQPEYYKKGSVYYAQGWSFVYFLNESKAARKNPAWSRILSGYFATLKSSYREALDALGPDPVEEKVREAQLKARKAAVEKAFAGLNMEELEKAWAEFVGKLKDPAAK